MTGSFPRASIALSMLILSWLCNQSIAQAQSAQTMATVTGTVQRSDGSPIAHATVQLAGVTTLTSLSDASGTFIFSDVPFGNYRVVVNVKGLGQETREHISVAGDLAVTIRYAPTLLNGLKVIASVSALTHGQISIQPISVTTLTPQTLADQGENTWQHVLNEIPGVNVGIGSGASTAPSSNSWNQVYPGSPLGAQILQIGGALNYESSASIDGMPIATQSFASSFTSGTGGTGSYGNGGVDLSVLAPNAFSQYNVNIGPGADSPSIVNSVGGSLDLTPPGYVDKDRADFSISTDPYGGIISNASLAIRRGSLSANVTYGINDSPGPLGHAAREPYLIFFVTGIDGRPFICPVGCYSEPYYLAPNATGYQYNGGSFTSSLLGCCYNLSSAWEQHSGS